MAKAEIPDWFDLKAYQVTLSPNQWLARISFRVAYLEYKPLFRDLTEQEDMFHFFSGICLEQCNMPNNYIDPLPVKCMSAADLAVLSACWSRDQSWQTLYQKMCTAIGTVDPGAFFNEVIEIKNSDPTLKHEARRNTEWMDYYSERFIHGAAITVNLNHDDEAIKQAFSEWLAGIRGGVNERFKKPINDGDFQKWQKYKILAAFDLCQWAEIKGFRFTNKQLANALFPPESIEFDERDVDMTERVRKLVNPLKNQCFTHKTVMLLEAAIRLSGDDKPEDSDIEFSGPTQYIPARLLDIGKDLVERHHRRMVAAREAE